MAAYTKMSLAYGEHKVRIEDFFGAPQISRALNTLIKKVVKSSDLDVEPHAVGWVGIDFASADVLEGKVRAECEVIGPKALPEDLERAKRALNVWRSTPVL